VIALLTFLFNVWLARFFVERRQGKCFVELAWLICFCSTLGLRGFLLERRWENVLLSSRGQLFCLALGLRGFQLVGVVLSGFPVGLHSFCVFERR
jgi:hypothetical protein